MEVPAHTPKAELRLITYTYITGLTKFDKINLITLNEPGVLLPSYDGKAPENVQVEQLKFEESCHLNRALRSFG